MFPRSSHFIHHHFFCPVPVWCQPSTMMICTFSTLSPVDSRVVEWPSVLRWQVAVECWSSHHTDVEQHSGILKKGHNKNTVSSQTASGYWMILIIINNNTINCEECLSSAWPLVQDIKWSFGESSIMTSFRSQFSFCWEFQLFHLHLLRHFLLPTLSYSLSVILNSPFLSDFLIACVPSANQPSTSHP